MAATRSGRSWSPWTRSPLCRWTPQRCSVDMSVEDDARSLLLRLRSRYWLGGEERRGLRRDPIEEVPGLHEAACIRARAEDHDRDVLTTLRKAQDGGQAVAGLRNEPGLSRPHVDVGTAQQVVRAVERDRALAGEHRVFRHA